jgi:hypothetical protein
MASVKTDEEFVAIVTWALERILQGEFQVARDAAGGLESLVLDRDFRPPTGTPEIIASVSDHSIGPELGPDSPLSRPLSAGQQCAGKIIRLFPKMVRRAGSVTPLPEGKQVPEYVRRYLLEASRCYVSGQFLAALFLCRSALGEAIIVSLRRKGYAEDLGALKEEGLKGILNLAQRKGLLDQSSHREADGIRTLANQAVHGIKLLTEEECKAAIAATREIVDRLYP